jgi:hypothetical protein
VKITGHPAEFAGKRVLVSGGTKGAGRSTVDRFRSGIADLRYRFTLDGTVISRVVIEP